MEEASHVQKAQPSDGPAIGVIANEDNLDSIARITMRARNNDHPVILAHAADIDLQELGIASREGVVVAALEDAPGDEVSLRRLIEITARAHDFPGVAIHADPEEYVDYEQVSDSDELRSEYVTDAPTHEAGVRSEVSVLVGIPAYNEVERIRSVVENVRPYADEVLVVDDGSDDATAIEAREAGATVVEHDVNRGYGAALKTVFEAAHRRGTESLIVIDGDGQHDPDDIPTLLAELDEENADIVIGSRFVEDAETDLPLYRRFGVTVINVLTNLSMGVVRPRSWVHDTQCGFRAYGKRAIASLAQDGAIGDEMDASTDILYHAHANRYSIREVGTTVDYDVENASTRSPVRHGLTLTNNILRTIETERPIVAFGIPGVATTATGLGIGYWTLSSFLSTGTISLGLALVAVFCILAGFLACVTAVILHSLSVHFENAVLPSVTGDR